MKEDLTQQEQERKDWHAGFAGGLEISFRKYKGMLSYEREHLLSKESLKVDFIVIKKESQAVIDNAVGWLFRTHNIVEYKNPNDELNVDVLWKVIGYAALYKSQGKTVNEIPVEDVTISIFRSSKPLKLFKSLKASGQIVENLYPGVYYVNGLAKIPIQIIVTSELEEADFAAIKILREHADRNVALCFINDIRKYTEQGDLENANAVLHLFRLTNKELIEEMRGEDDMVFEDVRFPALLDLFEDDLIAAVDKGHAEVLVPMTCRKLRKGKNVEQIAEELEIDVEYIEEICDVASEFAPDYDEHKVFEKIMSIKAEKSKEKKAKETV